MTSAIIGPHKYYKQIGEPEIVKLFFLWFSKKCVCVCLAWVAWNFHIMKLKNHDRGTRMYCHIISDDIRRDGTVLQVLEVAFVCAGALLFGPPTDPSKAVAPRRLLPLLLLGIVRKLAGRRGAEERLLQPLGRACLSVAGGRNKVLSYDTIDIIVL